MGNPLLAKALLLSVAAVLPAAGGTAPEAPLNTLVDPTVGIGNNNEGDTILVERGPDGLIFSTTEPVMEREVVA